MQLDVCIDADDSIKPLEIRIKRANRIRRLLLSEAEFSGLEEAVFGQDYTLFEIRKPLIAGFHRGLLMKGHQKAQNQVIYFAEDANFRQQQIRARSWAAGKLEPGMLSVPENPCSSGVLVEPEERIGSAVINYRGCEIVRIGEGSSYITPLTVKVTDRNPELSAAFRGSREFNASEDLGLEDFASAAGHHGCHYTFYVRVPGAKYLRSYNTLRNETIYLVQYDGGPVHRELVNNGDPPPTMPACSAYIEPQF